MEFKAQAKYVRISPRKVRVLVDVIKRLSPVEAVTKLSFIAKSGSKPVLKTLQSAIANLPVGRQVNEFRIKDILVGEGARMRKRDKSHRPGREGIIHKRMSHITVILSDQ